MKELEALKLLTNPIENVNSDYVLKLYKDIEDRFMLLKKALTPPTADEVCKALSEEFGIDVGYVNDNFINSIDKSLIIKMDSGILFRCDTLQPLTVELIGRFYRGVRERNE